MTKLAIGYLVIAIAFGINYPLSAQPPVSTVKSSTIAVVGAKVVLEANKLKFFDENGNVNKEMELGKKEKHITEDLSVEEEQYGIVSASGTAAGIIRSETEGEGEDAPSTHTFEYFSTQGEKLWSVSGIKPWVNSYPGRGVILSADGKRVALAIAQLPENSDLELYPNWAVVF